MAVKDAPNKPAEPTTAPASNADEIERQLHQDVAELVRHLPARQLDRTRGEVSPMRRLTALLVGAVQFAPFADPLAAAQARAAERQLHLLEQAGGLLTPDEVAERVGMSRQTVSNWRRARRLLAIPRGRRDFVYPAIQFAGTRVLPGLDLVLKASALRDPWVQLGMLLTPAETLGGNTPIQALRVGSIEPAVAVALRAGSPLDEDAEAGPVPGYAERLSTHSTSGRPRARTSARMPRGSR